MNWHEHITSDPSVAAGKPVIRGTRVAVDFLLGLLAAGWSAEQILANYPRVTPEALRAVYAFAAEILKEEGLYALRTGGA